MYQRNSFVKRFIIILSLLSCLFPQNDKHGCNSGDCSNGQGTYIWASGEKYVGDWKDGKNNGQGTYTWPDGRKYVGEFKDGLLNGQGTYTWPNGEKYVGDWKDGEHNGQGTFITTDGFSYEGDFKEKNVDDIKHFLISSSGTRYDGVITRGTKESGFGIFTVKSHISPDSVDRFGTSYEGEFKLNTFFGQGTITLPDGLKAIVGEFKDGLQIGKGTNTWPNGRKYVGGFKDDKANGQGTVTLPDGQKYVGEWKDGKYNGKGTNTWPNGQKYVEYSALIPLLQREVLCVDTTASTRSTC